MSSIREQALAAIKTALGANGTPAASITRSQLDQIQQGQLPCYDITPGDQKTEDLGTYGDHESVTHMLPVAVRAIIDAGATEGEDVDPTTDVDDSALDPFYTFAVQQLIGANANLGGVVLKISEVSAAMVFRPEGRDILGLEMNFELNFATKRGDPTLRG